MRYPADKNELSVGAHNLLNNKIVITTGDFQPEVLQDGIQSSPNFKNGKRQINSSIFEKANVTQVYKDS